MTFFNKKEEVLEVQLTRLGRERLAVGKFKPAYYEFVDEDILYDREYVASGSTEEQNETKTRIKKKLTLREPTARKEVKNSQQLIPIPFGNTVINLNKPTNKQIEGLGTFTPYSNYRPAWQLVAEDGRLFTGSAEMSFTPLEVGGGTTGPSYEKIPQLDLVCQYNYNLFSFDKNNPDTKYYADVQENPFIDFSDLFPKEGDDTFILFNKEFNDFTIEVTEENVINGKEDFVLEVFRYEYANNFQIASLRPLYFDEEDISNDSVGWFFNITTDADVEAAKEGFVFVDEDIDLEKVDDECIDI